MAGCCKLTRRRFLAGASALMLGGYFARRHFNAYKGRPYPVSDHCDGRLFFNSRNPITRTWRDVLEWKRHSHRGPWPEWVDIRVQPAPPCPNEGVTSSWINHATFLLRTSGLTVLTDPVYSERTSPVSWAGPKRVHAPGIGFEDLPEIDVVFLSHDHYDHCDMETLSRLAKRWPKTRLLTPLGNGALAYEAGFAAEQITELDWWEKWNPIPDYEFTLTPSRHWSNRVTGRRNGRLWGGFMLDTPDRKIFFAGDTGYDDQLFVTIRERLGAPDLAHIPIGAYDPRWFMKPFHCDPAEAVQIHNDLKALRSVSMHWGTFQLADDGREAPREELIAAREVAGLGEEAFRVLQPGEMMHV